MTAWSDCDVDDLAKRLASQGFKTSHARRLLRSFYEHDGSSNFSELSLPVSLRSKLQLQILEMKSQVMQRHVSQDGTVKLIIGLKAGGSVESVLMPAYRVDRAAACVSSQIGCAMGCDFCASTRNGLSRNLDAGEIVEQFVHLKRQATALGRKLKSLVFMGMGEPMHNLDQVIEAIKRIAEPDMGGLGWRQVTVSTVGIVPGIDLLADADLNVHLAVSLHGADDETRNRIVPGNRKYGIAALMSATRRFAQRTGRIPTIEWCMLAGINDSEEQAHMLADLMAGLRAHVNLIPWNSIGRGISGAIYAKPAPETMKAFAEILKTRKIIVHFRDTRGDDVSAACGQLQEIRKVMGIDLGR